MNEALAAPAQPWLDLLVSPSAVLTCLKRRGELVG